MNPTVNVPARAMGQNGPRVVSSWEAEVNRKLAALECEGAAQRSEIERLKRKIEQMEGVMMTPTRRAER
jgi:hypothetical protein